MRAAAYVFGIFGNFGGLIGGVFVLFRALYLLNDPSAPSDAAYFVLAAGISATVGALAGAGALILMSAFPRSRKGPVLLLAAAVAATLAIPTTLLGFSMTFIEFLLFPLSPAILLSAAAAFALLGRRADVLENVTAWEETEPPK